MRRSETLDADANRQGNPATVWPATDQLNSSHTMAGALNLQLFSISGKVRPVLFATVFGDRFRV